MILENSSLVHSTAGSTGFSVVGASKMLTFGSIAPSTGVGAVLQGLYPGGGAAVSSGTPNYPTVLVQEACVVRGITVTSLTAPGVGVTDRYRLVVNGTPSAVITTNLVGAAQTGSTTTGAVSQTIPAGALLAVELTTNLTASAPSVASGVIASLLLY